MSSMPSGSVDDWIIPAEFLAPTPGDGATVAVRKRVPSAVLVEAVRAGGELLITAGPGDALKVEIVPARLRVAAGSGMAGLG
jgi:hypothetical protein